MRLPPLGMVDGEDGARRRVVTVKTTVVKFAGGGDVITNFIPFAFS